MIEQMKKYTFLVFHRDYDTFLEKLRELGVVHVTEKAAGLADDPELQKTMARVDVIRKTIAQGAPDQLLQEKAAVEAKLAQAHKEADRMAVWGTYHSSRINDLREAGYCLSFYSCTEKAFDDAFGVEVNRAKGRVYFVQITKAGEAKVELPEVCSEEVMNEHSTPELIQDVQNLGGLVAAAQARIEAWQVSELPKLKAEMEHLNHEIDWRRVTLSSDKAADGALFILEGFCPVDNVPALEAMLKSRAAYYEAEDPREGDATPIKLKNNWFIRMFECLTGMYGMPNYAEFDPTPILGPFFLLFFSLCIGDAGYGLVLILVGFLIHKGKLKIEMFDGMGPIIMALGVGSAVIGYLMGGFFGINIFAAEWIPAGMKAFMFNNLGEGTTGKITVGGSAYDVMMVLAIVIGIVHLILAMTIKAITFTKRFGFKNTVSTWGWLVLILGGLSTAILAATNLLSFEAIQITLIVIGVISALGIFIFNTPGRNPLINVGAGLWDTYGMVTGILGDVLSYIRLYALGLAGGMLGMAFNQLGEMVLGSEPNVGTWIGFILIVTFGHVLNLLMACLGAFVHPLRLSFVEYFKNAGYEGSGKVYAPFKN